MAFTFPANKLDFTAPNGITYSWDTDDEKWVVATFAGEHKHQDLENAVELAQNGVDANALLIQNNTDDIAAIPNDYYNKSEIDIQQQAQDNRIEELEISKGKVARYITDNTVGTPVSRPGELAVNSASPSSVTVVSLGVEDADNVLTKPMADGDIIEFVDAVSGKISRYKINDASAAPTVVTVEHISGNNDFANGEEEQVYIYPQNEAGASQSYVDAQDQLGRDYTDSVDVANKAYTDAQDLLNNAYTDQKDNDNRTDTEAKLNLKADSADVTALEASKLNITGGQVSSYVDFNNSAGKSGVRFFRGSDKYFSIWSGVSVGETRARIDLDKSFKLTGYRQGNSTEHRLVYWNTNAGLFVNKLVTPTSDDMPVTLGYNKTNYLSKADASSTYLTGLDADATYLKITDYVPGGGVTGGLPTTGGTVSGTITSKTGGGGSTSAIRITNKSDNKLAFFLWSPSGSGSPTKFVGRYGAEHWFQVYDSSDGDVKTTAKFGHGSYEFKVSNSIGYSATDAHYFKGQVRFSSGADDLKLSQTPSNLDVYTTARFTSGVVVKATGEAIGGNNSFAAFPDHTTYAGRQTEDTDIVNKKYIDDKIAALEARVAALETGYP